MWASVSSFCRHLWLNPHLSDRVWDVQSSLACSSSPAGGDRDTVKATRSWKSNSLNRGVHWWNQEQVLTFIYSLLEGFSIHPASTGSTQRFLWLLKVSVVERELSVCLPAVELDGALGIHLPCSQLPAPVCHFLLWWSELVSVFTHRLNEKLGCSFIYYRIWIYCLKSSLYAFVLVSESKQTQSNVFNYFINKNEGKKKKLFNPTWPLMEINLSHWLTL